MIAFVRTAAINPGKTAAALSFAVTIAAYVKENYERDIEVLRPIGGNPYRVAWSARYSDRRSA